ncbi:MAG TPA: hypothetical protein VK939_06155 [Longimicrobiales bacterium]|nr:hypothetical protein [Longimicrobiales bacterium]
MIEQMAAMIARLRKLIAGRDLETADTELRQAAGMYGVDLDSARAVDAETLLLLLSPTGQPEPARAWITAELLTLDGLRLEAEGDARAAHSVYAKALLLYNALDPAAIGGLPEAGDRIGELRAKLIELEPWEDG